MLKKLLKNRNNRLMLVILIIGIAFTVFAIPENDADREQAMTQYFGEEERLSEILSEIEGAGEVSVMISYVSTAEKDIVRDKESGRAITSGGDVVVSRELYPQVKGVIVIADGAGRAEVRQSVTDAVVAVTGVGANRVKVFKRAE